MYGREALAHREAAKLLQEVQAILDKADEDALRVIDEMSRDRKTASVVDLARYQSGRSAFEEMAARQMEQARQAYTPSAFGGLFGGLVG